MHNVVPRMQRTQDQSGACCWPFSLRSIPFLSALGSGIWRVPSQQASVVETGEGKLSGSTHGKGFCVELFTSCNNANQTKNFKHASRGLLTLLTLHKVLDQNSPNSSPTGVAVNAERLIPVRCDLRRRDQRRQLESVAPKGPPAGGAPRSRSAHGPAQGRP